MLRTPPVSSLCALPHSAPLAPIALLNRMDIVHSALSFPEIVNILGVYGYEMIETRVRTYSAWPCLVYLS